MSIDLYLLNSIFYYDCFKMLRVSFSSCALEVDFDAAWFKLILQVPQTQIVRSRLYIPFHGIVKGDCLPYCILGKIPWAFFVPISVDINFPVSSNLLRLDVPLAPNAPIRSSRTDLIEALWISSGWFIHCHCWNVIFEWKHSSSWTTFSAMRLDFILV